MDHCHAEDFNGGQCNIAHAKKHGGIGFCRSTDDCDGPSESDLMFVKPQSKQMLFISSTYQTIKIIKNRNLYFLISRNNIFSRSTQSLKQRILQQLRQ